MLAIGWSRRRARAVYCSCAEDAEVDIVLKFEIICILKTTQWPTRK